MLNDLVKMNQDLANRIQEQAKQIAWLQRQLFGRKSEKIPAVDPNQLSLFTESIPQETVEAQQVATTQIEKETPEDIKQKRKNRKMMANLKHRA